MFRTTGLILLFAATAAVADVCGPAVFGTAAAFNVFVFGDMNSENSDVQGRVAVGRDATYSHYSIGKEAHQNPYKFQYSLVVGRDIAFTDGTVWNGALAYGRWENVPQFSVATPYGKSRTRPIDFVAFESQIHAFSEALARLPAEGSVTFSANELRLSSRETNFVTFVVRAIDLAATRKVIFDVPATASIVVRVEGSLAQFFEVGFEYGTASPMKVFWHFPQATQLEIRHIGLRGALLAPLATLHYHQGNMRGPVIVKNFLGDGQVDHAAFTGCIPTK